MAPQRVPQEFDNKTGFLDNKNFIETKKQNPSK
jgi:hypothetical protein